MTSIGKIINNVSNDCEKMRCYTIPKVFSVLHAFQIKEVDSRHFHFSHLVHSSESLISRSGIEFTTREVISAFLAESTALQIK